MNKINSIFINYKRIFLGSFIFVFYLLNCQNANKGILRFSPFPGEADPPKVLLASPATGSQNLPQAQKFSILFSKPMNMDTCRQSFNLLPSVLGFFDSTDTTLNFTPSKILSYGSYVYSISKSCEDKDGRDLKDPFTASISIGSVTGAGTNPTVSNIYVYSGTSAECNAGSASLTDFLNSNVTNACQGNPNTNSIVISFSGQMNQNTTRNSISISPSIGASFVWSASGNMLTITPDTPLVLNQRYSITVGVTASDTQNNPMLSPVNSSFLVGSGNSNPTVNSINVFTGTAVTCSAGTGAALNILSSNVLNACQGNPGSNSIVYNFSIPMDSSATQNAILISPAISGSYTWSGGNQVLTFTSDNPLAFNTRYTVTIAVTAKAANQAFLATPITGSFLVGTGNSNPAVSSINVFTGTAPVCIGGGGVATDILAVNVVNACLKNPTSNSIVFNFASPMDPGATQSAINISPLISGTYTWSGGNQILTLVSDNPLTYGTRYTITISQSARTSAFINLTSPVNASFVAGALNSSAHVQAIGITSQPGCPATFPGVGNAVGGNWLLGSCWWDDSLPILSTGSYTYRSGDTGAGLPADCADVSTDNFRIIFSDYMNITSTLGAISLTRSSPPLTTIQLSNWSWSDCQIVSPFGCRVIDLVYSEQEASCNGALFGNATTGGDFNLLRTNNAPANYPYYILQISNLAIDANGRAISPSFSFTFEGK